MESRVRVSRIVRSPAGALAGRRSRAHSSRSWRRRGRRAQVSAVATIFGLLLVVTFIANYISTTLPQQMTINDINRDLTTENEVGRLTALLQQAAAQSATGSQFSQPIVLGSQGEPPFAGPDNGAIGPLAGGASEALTFTLSGPFAAPYPGVPNSGSDKGCSISATYKGHATGISCTVASTVVWNFSAGDGLHYYLNGTVAIGTIANFSTNNSIVSIGSSGGAGSKIYIDGSNDTVYVNASVATSIAVTVVGNYDTLALGATAGAGYNILEVGSHDSISTSVTGGGGLKLVGFGQYDSLTASGVYLAIAVYYTGFNLFNPSTYQCPYANSALTNTVGGTAGTVTYNDTTYTNSGHTGNASGWTYNYNNPATSNCPFVTVASSSTLTLGSGFVVRLHNTYAPRAEVADDFGAVVFAQYGGIPVLIDPPPISLVGTSITLWVPALENQIGDEAGTGTAALEFRLVSVQTSSWPSGAYHFLAGSQVSLVVKTPYAAAWMQYFNASSSFAGDASCVGTSHVCSGTYAPFGPLGTVTLSVPVTSVVVEVATFSATLT